MIVIQKKNGMIQPGSTSSSISIMRSKNAASKNSIPVTCFGSQNRKNNHSNIMSSTPIGPHDNKI